jgi:isoamylase
LAGDECGRSQGGNNNAYCQDTELNWISWDRDERSQAILAFTHRVIALRGQHPALHHGRYLGRFDFPDNPRDLVWLTCDATEMDGKAWADESARGFGMLIDVPAGDEADRDVVLLAFNGFHDAVPFTLPASPLGGEWRRLLDTNLDVATDAEQPTFPAAKIYELTARSVLLFEAVRAS